MSTSRTAALAERALNDARLCRRQGQAIADQAAELGWSTAAGDDLTPADQLRDLAARGLHCLEMVSDVDTLTVLRGRRPDVDELVADLQDQLRALALVAEANTAPVAQVSGPVAAPEVRPSGLQPAQPRSAAPVW